MTPDLLKLASYDYPLPKELIAQHPTAERRESRLMHVQRKSAIVQHRKFSDILQLLNAGDVLVINSSKVFPARLFATKENGSTIEVLLLHQIEEQLWKCMVSPGKRLKTAQWLQFSDSLRAYVSPGDSEGLREIRFESDLPFWDEIYRIGHIPLPPYIVRNDNVLDHERYQTVYAKELGSVAAPTAGLHFDAELIKALANKGIIIAEVVLHVGIGTFRPVKADIITDHVMHAELATISESSARQIQLAKDEHRRVVCVGTTSARSVESFWSDGIMQSGSKWTDIFIYPGVDFNVVDAMITNFHLPQSTLLMMISALGGYELIMHAYSEAISNRYRFFSYGDAMFIED
ncbi:MAG: tRNA preQ1(34) S-adenosylmethionine ribosyltransferase-isomerase QueA [Candidatus Cloacimonetes bacterium HGW-Cloacimonetes-3]|jgi:S-adenosylmethionine:tRNA ribosyltransferase-isomerase|nr:MAG: tRNA preQ1(34) S-adenosylmethionine ribosyltransferase-isomerase QueA [Candidatus Cloacimonetes bacterium HGW-Cloacimonetes-3]